jgi:hypothetical protein
MIKLSITGDLSKLEISLQRALGKRLNNAIAVALTRTAAQARQAIRHDLPDIFDRPTPFTVNSIRYTRADPVSLRAAVFISDDAAKGTSPRQYLFSEIEGGARGLKRGERALISKGLMEPDQRTVPGSGMRLNQYGNIPGSRMVQILSSVGALGEQGYQGNATAKTQRRRARAKIAVASTGTNYFIGKSRLDGGPGAVYQLVSRGVVQPVLWFVRRAPRYRARFDFHGLVAEYAERNFPREMLRAMYEAAKKAP